MRLFKYMPETRLNDILVRRNLRFSPFSALNDPFDSLPTFLNQGRRDGGDTAVLLRHVLDRMRDWEDDSNYRLATSLLKGIFPNLSNDVGLFAAAEHRLKEIAREYPGWMITTVRQFWSQVRELVGVLSLSETANSAPMWAHYAENGRGFVAEFDTGHDWFSSISSFANTYSRPKAVQYMQARPNVERLEAMSLDLMFFTKSDDWIYEREWRLITLLDAKFPGDPASVKGVCDFPAECLRSLTLGWLASSACFDLATRLVSLDPELRHVQLFTCQPAPDKYEVEPMPLQQAARDPKSAFSITKDALRDQVWNTPGPRGLWGPGVALMVLGSEGKNGKADDSGSVRKKSGMGEGSRRKRQ